MVYERDVKPLLTARCYACHAHGTTLGGFQVDSRAGILAGSRNTHPVVLPGRGAESYLVRLVAGKVPGKVMPPKGARLTPGEVAVLRAWVDAGLPFGAGSAAAAWQPVLSPRRPRLPDQAPGSGLAHPVDRLLQPYFRQHRVRHAAPVDDRSYARRVYLDLIGMLPTAAELRAFLMDRDPEKRAHLARRLLADERRYTEHWLSFWSDLLRSDYVGTGYIDGGRAPIVRWLYQALLANKPYDRFVAELVNPTPESAGFVKGIVWRGVVNASQTPPMQAAQSISQVFLGINLKCASCHDSFINNWKLADAYGMAGIYSDTPLEMVRCDKPTGTVAPVRFLFPALGSIDAASPREKRTEQLAALLTAKQNGRLARTLVNRLWARLLGRGLVEPTDEMDQRPWDPDLLDWLATDFADRGYDMKLLLERIVTSRAYQLPAVPQGVERAKQFVFAGPVVKRMTAEQFADAVSSLTGVWSQPANGIPLAATLGRRPEAPGVQHRTGVLRSGSVEVEVDVEGARYLSLVVLDGGDGANSDWANWCDPRLLVRTATGTREMPLAELKWETGVTGFGQIRIDRNVMNRPLRLGERTYARGLGVHADSVLTFALPAGALRFRAAVGPDAGAAEPPGSRTSVEFVVAAGDRPFLEARAALAVADPLTRALGRPNREQVVTQRSPTATTLQALELTNGQTLATALARGAERRLSAATGVSPDPVRFVTELYECALCRLPTPTERMTAVTLLGTSPTREGMEDLLWALVMLPEFQLIQ